ncbi:hypothetical protein DX933_17240 [Ornithinibacillus gellani]|nr:hypothetical protein DX933_17240 [Ornithinibacillus gellani]
MITGLVSGGSTASKGLIGSTNNQWGEVQKPPLIEVSLYHRLTGCKIPHQVFLLITSIVSGGSTASKGLIGSTNNPWGKCKNPR